MRVWIFLLLLYPLPSPLYPAFSSKDKGTTSAGFLKIGVDARAVAMGEAFSALASDAKALYWNPAGLVQTPSRSATFMHALYLDSSFFDYLAYSQGFGQTNAFGAGLQYFSAGKIMQTDEAGTQTGSFTPNDMALTLGYGHKIRDFSFGLNAKFIQSKIIDSANAYAADLGFVMTPRFFDNRLNFAFTATNLGTSMKFGGKGKEEKLPMALRLGSALRITWAWIASLDGIFPNDDDPYAALGAEYVIPAGKNFQFAVRAGVNTMTMGEIDGLTGLSMGFGLSSRSYGINYALVPFGNLGLAHRLSLSWRFRGTR